jgi:hypothetical protein
MGASMRLWRPAKQAPYRGADAYRRPQIAAFRRSFIATRIVLFRTATGQHACRHDLMSGLQQSSFVALSISNHAIFQAEGALAHSLQKSLRKARLSTFRLVEMQRETSRPTGSRESARRAICIG